MVDVGSVPAGGAHSENVVHELVDGHISYQLSRYGSDRRCVGTSALRFVDDEISVCRHKKNWKRANVNESCRRIRDLLNVGK